MRNGNKTSQILDSRRRIKQQKTSQKENIVMNIKQYKKQMIAKQKVLQKLFGICSNRFSSKIWRNVIFLDTTFINYFK